MGVASTALKYVYQRPRPSIEWLIDTIGYSFPSWHTASTMMIAGAVVIIVHQRMKKGIARLVLQAVLILLAVLVAVSRIYIGVHYPTDIIGGWLLAVTLLQMMYPFYDQKRFEWRFQSKQNSQFDTNSYCKGRSFNLPSFVEVPYFTRFIENELRHSAIS